MTRRTQPQARPLPQREPNYRITDIRIRIEPERKQRWQAAAAVAGQTLSAWLEDAAEQRIAAKAVR